MDLGEAFVCVNHNLFLSKLKRYGIHAAALQWINGYTYQTENIATLRTKLTDLH